MQKTTFELDATDLKLLAHLQKDGKASLQELSAAVGLSPSPCWRRIRRMEEIGVIRGYVARLDPKALGLHALAYVFVTLIDHREESIAGFARLVAAEARIVECASVTGGSDYVSEGGGARSRGSGAVPDARRSVVRAGAGEPDTFCVAPDQIAQPLAASSRVEGFGRLWISVERECFQLDKPFRRSP